MKAIPSHPPDTSPCNAIVTLQDLGGEGVSGSGGSARGGQTDAMYAFATRSVAIGHTAPRVSG